MERGWGRLGRRVSRIAEKKVTETKENRTLVGNRCIHIRLSNTLGGARMGRKWGEVNVSPRAVGGLKGTEQWCGMAK